MKTVLIIHGIGGHAGIHWQQWLSEELQAQGYKVLMPNLPDSEKPDRKVWLDKIKEALQGADLKNLTIVGHSLGATTALDFVEQASEQVRELITISGFAKEYGSELNQNFLAEKPIDFKKVKQRLSQAVVIYSDDDPYVPQEALKYVADSLDEKPLIISGGGHLNAEAGYNKFPRLLELIK